MPRGDKDRFLSTMKKDEAAFYLSELARGLLKDRISLRVVERNLVMAAFDAVHLEMKALDRDGRHAIEIRLSWRTSPPPAPGGGGDGCFPPEEVAVSPSVR